MLGRPTTPTRDQRHIAGYLTSLNASTANATGTSFDLGAARRVFAAQGKITRASTATSPTTVTLRLQGSLDGNVWTNLSAAVNATTGGVIFASTVSVAVTRVRLNSTGKGAGAGAFTVTGLIAVAEA